METKAKKKLSRRDALKILGAATGAAVFANLPAKWTAPKLISGVLPAHAQTSIVEPIEPEPNCTDFAVRVEVISQVTNFPTLSVEQGPAPDQSTFPGGVGTFAIWDCQTGCLQLRVGIGPSLDSSATLEITTLADTFQVSVEGLFVNTARVLINMETGEYSTNINEPIDGCEWVN
jgi:hypothetical protein